MMKISPPSKTPICPTQQSNENLVRQAQTQFIFTRFPLVQFPSTPSNSIHQSILAHQGVRFSITGNQEEIDKAWEKKRINFNPFHDLWEYELKEAEFRSLSNDQIERFLKGVRPDINIALKKRPDGYELMRQMFELVRNYKVLEELSNYYSGAPGIFWKKLQWHVQTMRQARELNEQGQFDLDIYLDLPGLEPIRALWHRYKKSGWKARLYYNTDMGSAVTVAQIDPSRKTVTIPLEPISTRPTPLVVAEEVLHILQDELILLNEYYLLPYIHARIQKHLETSGISIDDPEHEFILADKHREILHEYDVRLRLIPIYTSLVKKMPQFKTTRWDDISDYWHYRHFRNPMLEYMKRTCYAHNIPDIVFDIVRTHSFYDLITILHGIRAKDLPRIEPLLHPPADIPQEVAGTILRNTPEVLKRITWDSAGADFNREATLISNKDIEGVIHYLMNPIVCMRPLELGLILNEGKDRDISEQSGAVAICRSIAKGITLLKYYDMHHDTWYTRKVGLDLIRSFQPPAHIGQLVTVAFVAKQILDDHSHEGLADYLEAIHRSPTRSLLYRIHEEEYKGFFIGLIKAASTLETEDRPDPKVITELAEEYFDRLRNTVEINEREFRSEAHHQNMEAALVKLTEIPQIWSRARDLAHTLKDYFTKIGDNRSAQHYGNLYGKFKHKADQAPEEIGESLFKAIHKKARRKKKEMLQQKRQRKRRKGK